ncbi:MAG: two component transcriptional regulator, LytTR family [Bacteroidetes bacterium]|nr:two component transcriptional regulator, LytTR family [Bacteroidota bacterium]
MRINCVIIEDEPLAMERTKSYVLKLPHLQLLATFDNSMEALAFLKSNLVDLIFLDINLGEISGIQLLEASGTKAEVIITTAYNEYALKGFELNVTDYLLKPFTFERFYQAVERVENELSKSHVAGDKKFIFVKTEYRLEKIQLDEILYIEGMRDYRRIHTVNKRIMTLQTFKDLEKEIPASIICRVHKSFMVSIAKIDSVERDRIKINEVYIPVSETYKKTFLALIHPSAS